MVIVAILIALSLKKAKPDVHSEKVKIEESIGRSVIKAFKTQTKALSSGTMFPLLLSNMF